MSQKIWTSIDPEATSGLMLAGLLDDFKDAIVSGFAGNSRPPNLQAGGAWIDTTNQGAPDYYWAYKFYTGTEDVEVFRISVLNNLGGALTADSNFKIEVVSGSSAGAFIDFVKRRTANNGQVLSGDVAGEIRFIGRTNTGTDPLCAFFHFTATDNMTTAQLGGTLSFYSTPDATSIIREHFRLINGEVEMLQPLAINSKQLVANSVATSGAIAALTASKPLVELTGSTTTVIRGINASQETKRLIIHNRSSANVTFNHEDAGATAANRLRLPNASNLTIGPNQSITFFYSADDSRWKLQSVIARKRTKVLEKLNGAFQQWTPPSGITKIRITTYESICSYLAEQKFIDAYGTLYTWGLGFGGVLGDGTTVLKSSPVLIAGPNNFLRFGGELNNGSFGNNTTKAITFDGRILSWGVGQQVGDNTIVNKSSPVFVVGPNRYANVFTGKHDQAAYAMDGVNQLWGWGNDANWQLFGVTGNASTSSPVSIYNQRISRMMQFYANPFLNPTTYLIYLGTGDAYCAGPNDFGSLGLGDTTMRTSFQFMFVADVPGWKKIVTASANSRTVGVLPATYGLSADGDMYGWGFNESGNLGIGNTAMQSSPVLVVGGHKFYDFFNCEENGDSVFAIKADGSLFAWGYNGDGQLGIGDVADRSSPVAVLGGLRFSSVSVGKADPSATGTFVVAVTTSGDLYAWGKNTNSVLGLGDTTSRSSPVLITSAGQGWSWVKCFGDKTFAVKADGSMWAWGSNSNSALALGTTGAAQPYASSPILVAGPGSVRADLHIENIELEVSPTTYNVSLSQGPSFFGPHYIGDDIDSITIEYAN